MLFTIRRNSSRVASLIASERRETSWSAPVLWRFGISGDPALPRDPSEFCRVRAAERTFHWGLVLLW